MNLSIQEEEGLQTHTGTHPNSGVWGEGVFWFFNAVCFAGHTGALQN